MNKFLMYHSIGGRNNSEVGAELYDVSSENFRKQMLVVHGPQSTVHGKSATKARTVSLGSLRDSPLWSSVKRCEGDSPFAVGGSPCITFDDGLLDNYTVAYPILKEIGIKAYFFILVGRIGTAGYMNWQQIKELKAVGMTIGSHGMTHRILTELNDKELSYELKKSKKMLEENLGQAVDYLSIPRGFHNIKVIDKAKEVGYKAVFTSNPKDTDEFKVGRIPVKGNWNLEHFISVVNNGLSFKDKSEELIKSSTKKILGTKNYDRLRTKILKK